MEKLRREQIDTDLLELSERKLHRPQRVAVSARGMVVTAHYRASEAGCRDACRRRQRD